MSSVGIIKEQAAIYHQIVSIQLSWNCNAACRHCLVTGKKNRSRVMSLSEGKRILDELGNLPLTHHVGFSGGEAFLHYDLLMALCAYAQQNFGHSFGIATNCFWASDRAKAHEMLSPLASLGLTDLLISLDDFHLEFVDAQCIRNCINEALDLGLNVVVQTVKTKTGHAATYFQEQMGFPGPPAVMWVEIPCHPVGRAIGKVPEDEYTYTWQNKPGYCTALRVWNVDPYGFVAPCCGTAFAPALRVGNALRENLSDIVNRANVNPLLNTIAAWGGPYMLIKILEHHGDFRYSQRFFASHCHACATVLQDAQAMKTLERELTDHCLDALTARLAAHTLWYRYTVLSDEDSQWLPEGWLPDEKDRVERHP
jgi:hypothetical protein